MTYAAQINLVGSACALLYEGKISLGDVVIIDNTEGDKECVL